MKSGPRSCSTTVWAMIARIGTILSTLSFVLKLKPLSGIEPHPLTEYINGSSLIPSNQYCVSTLAMFNKSDVLLQIGTWIAVLRLWWVLELLQPDVQLLEIYQRVLLDRHVSPVGGGAVDWPRARARRPSALGPATAEVTRALINALINSPIQAFRINSLLVF